MNYAIEMCNITKDFPGIRANDNITLQVKKGEIHALLGENGAGKSTLMSILFGLYQPTSGIIKINGQQVNINNPNDATKLHIGMVHQHFKLVDCFSVIDNIILGIEDTKYGFVIKNSARDKIMQLSKKYNLAIDLDSKIENIHVGAQQRVEILKMLYRDNEILIFDEPTAVLAPAEIKELLKVMKNLAAEGKSIIFITHKINEIIQVADRCTVLRKGKYVATVDVENVSKEQLASMMVGRAVLTTIIKKPAKPTEEILNVKDLCVYSTEKNKNIVHNVSFNVKRGEIVCIAGIEGNGQSEVIYAIQGLIKARSGKINFMGQDITYKSIFKRNNLGMSHIPEDRHKYGLILDYNLADNLVLKKYKLTPFSKSGFINRNQIINHSNELIRKFDIRCSQGSETNTRSMSGGNQQKGIVAREIDFDGDLLMAIQPTRGLDIGAIEYIDNQIVKQRDSGKAVLLMSLELDEVLNLSDRILVMYEGEIVADSIASNTSIEELGMYMSGAKRQGVTA